MIKLFLKDILGFLENVEDIALKKKKLNNYEKMKNELESIKYQLKMKTYNEHKTKNELEILAQENSVLKLKIKSLNQRIFNLSNNISNYNFNERFPKSPLVRNPLRHKKTSSTEFGSRPIINNTKILINKRFSCSIDKTKMSEKNIIKKINTPSNNIHKIGIPNLKNENVNTDINDINANNKKDKNNINGNIQKLNKENSKKNHSKINYNKFINNNKSKKHNKLNRLNIINNSKNSNLSYKKDFTQLYLSKKNSSSITNISKIAKNEKRNSSSKSSNASLLEARDEHKYSPNNSFDLPSELNQASQDKQDYEEIKNNINSVFDDELNQLEQDEENIKRLLEQLNDGKSKNLFEKI